MADKFIDTHDLNPNTEKVALGLETGDKDKTAQTLLDHLSSIDRRMVLQDAQKYITRQNQAEGKPDYERYLSIEDDGKATMHKFDRLGPMWWKGDQTVYDPAGAKERLEQEQQAKDQQGQSSNNELAKNLSNATSVGVGTNMISAAFNKLFEKR